MLYYYYYYYLNCKWVFTRWQCTTIRHNTQITHITQTNTAHKTTQTIKDTLHTMNTITATTNTIKTTCIAIKPYYY
jgi:hypothetical protein